MLNSVMICSGPQLFIDVSQQQQHQLPSVHFYIQFFMDGEVSKEHQMEEERRRNTSCTKM